jgi:hypothetical protein
MTNKDYYNDTSNTAAGINTPANHENSAPTDMVSDAVEQIVDHIQEAFEGKKEHKEHR